MPANESLLVVPLRSNASALLAGAPIAAMRRRLKFASLFYDRLLLETGIFRVQAGPRGSSSFIVPPSDNDPPRWQTPAERHAATGVTFAVAVSPESGPDSPRRTVVQSEAAIAWTATLHPFEDELPPGTDWVEFVTSINPSGEIKQIADRWTWADRHNRALERAVPISFVRETIINSANRDLVLAAAAGISVATDRLHSQVVAQRFNDQEEWRLQGYVIPLIFPQVGELSWGILLSCATTRTWPSSARSSAMSRKRPLLMPREATSKRSHAERTIANWPTRSAGLRASAVRCDGQQSASSSVAALEQPRCLSHNRGASLLARPSVPYQQRSPM